MIPSFSSVVLTSRTHLFYTSVNGLFYNVSVTLQGSCVMITNRSTLCSATKVQDL